MRRFLLGYSVLFGLLLSLPACAPRSPKDAPEALQFWTAEGYQPEEVAVLRDLAAAFERQTGVPVQVEFFTWEEITSKLLAAVSAGAPPTIGQHGPDLALRFADEGRVASMDEVIEAVGKPRFYPEFLEAVGWYQGHYWSVPWFIEVRPLLVRADWLRELQREAPRTWDEWLAVCQAMTADLDGDGQLDRWGFGLYGRDFFGQNWVAMAAANGGGLFAEDGAITVDSAANVEALQWYADLFLKHGVTPPGTKSASWMDANAYYKRGLVGTLVTNGYILNELRKDAPEVYANSVFVPMPSRRTGEPSRSYLGGSHLVVFKDGPRADRAGEFIRFLLQDENYLRFLQSTTSGALPVLRDVGRHAYFQDDPNRRVLVGQIDGAVRHGFRGPPRPAVGAVEGERVFGAALEAVLSGAQTSAEALAEARRRTEAIFARQGASSP